MTDLSRLSRRERQIMEVLFARDEATVNEIQAELPKPPAHTAVRTMLKILEDKKLINWDKARDVLASVGYSGQVSNYMTMGKPKFHDVAAGNADELADRGDQRLLLISLPAIVELSLLEVEGKKAKGTLLEVLENGRGHYLEDRM